MKSIWRDNPPRTENPLTFFLFSSRPHWRMALLAVFCVIVASVLNALVPYLLKVIVDTAAHLTDQSYGTLVNVVLIYLGVSLSAGLIWRASGFSGMVWATGARATARDTLMSHLTLHSHQYFSNRFAGSLLSRVKQAGDGMRDFTQAFLWQLLRFVVSLIASFTVVFFASPLIAAVLAALFFVLIPLNVFFAGRRVPLSVAGQAAETALNGATVDTLTNISAMQEYARRGHELKHLRELTVTRRNAGMRNWRYGEWVLLLNGILQTICIGGVIFVSLYLASKGLITAGDIVLFLTMIFLLEDQLTFIGGQFNELAENWGQVKESLAEILVVHDVTDASHATPLTAPSGTLAFEDVSFNYDGVSVFKNLSFTIPAGQKVGVIGRSGAGKSTLIKLILRHYDLASGTISIGGTNISFVTKESLRSSISLVPQEPALFHRSIAENIAYGKLDASKEEIVEAAKLAQAHEFIELLPNGYEALVGERGIKLSGGQRQRIAIARALIKNAPILLLDEATSALDSESEVAVQKALLTLMEGRTVIAIAHRLSTLRAMDRLMVFDNGSILEEGTHQELIERGGLYADLWNHQAGGFLEE